MQFPLALCVSHQMNQRTPSQVIDWKVSCSCEPFKKHVIMDQSWTRV